MGGDGGVTRAEDGASVIDALLDEIGVPDGVLTDGPVDDIGLGGVDERRKIADPLFGPSSTLMGAWLMATQCRGT